MILAISIVVEVIGDAMLTASHGYDHALLGIDLGIAYATWSSVGIIVTSCVGYLFYKQKLTKIGYISLLVIMISTITLNLLG